MSSGLQGVGRGSGLGLEGELPPVGRAADSGARAAYRVDLVASDHLELCVADAVSVEDDALRRDL
eukprot:scaffold50969_cov69-Phaeocystis_antarctica.AAC.4